MVNQQHFLFNAIAALCRRIDQKGWTANHDGNITLRHDNLLLATPSAVSKANITPELILTLDNQGKKLEGVGKPFSELNLHLALYRARPDISAIVHAHPPFTMARGLIRREFPVEVPEAIISIGPLIPVIPYALPGDPGQELQLAQAAALSDLFMIAGNGVFATGRDPEEAFLRIELLEHLLKIDFYARLQGDVMVLPEDDRRKLLEKRAALGLSPHPATPPITSLSPEPPPTTPLPSRELIKSIIAEELKKLLST